MINVRIAIDSSTLINDTIKEYVKTKLMPEAISWYTNVLKVRRLTANIKFANTETTCGGDITIPAAHKLPSGAGVEGDLLIYVTVAGTQSDSYIAYASHCMLNSAGDNRPIAGSITFNPFQLNPDSTVWD
jgi:Leishmanolysin